MDKTGQIQKEIENWFHKMILVSTLSILLGNTTYSKTHVVKIIAEKFVPDRVEIKVGDTVTWVNTTGDYHTSTSGVNCNGDGFWDSGIIENGKQFTHVFKKKGSFPYFCMPHCRFGMKGLITVVDATVSNGKTTSMAGYLPVEKGQFQPDAWSNRSYAVESGTRAVIRISRGMTSCLKR